MLDKPNERSSHKVPTPRIGGVGIVGTISILGLLSILTWSGTTTWFATSLALVFALAVVGFVDDHRGLSSKARFTIQVLLVLSYFLYEPVPQAITSTSFGRLALGVWGLPLAVIASVWLINAFNFMDGIDGLIGFQTIVYSAGLLCVTQGADPQLTLLLLITLGATSGFLVFNYPPANIFMGDVGSTALGGFVAVCTFRTLSQHPTQSPLTYALLTFPIVFDATFTLVRRILQGEKWYAAHRTHIYQRPQNWGWSHRQTTGVAVVLMLVSSSIGLLHFRLQSNQHADWLFLAATTIMSVVAVVVLLKDKRTTRSSS